MNARDALANTLADVVLGRPASDSSPSAPAVRAKRSATIGRIKGLSTQEHSIRLSEHVKDLDANPRTEATALGVWSSGKGGTSTTAFTTPPVVIRSKRKYRGG